MTYAKEAANVFVHQVVENKNDYRVGLATFNSTAQIHSSLTDSDDLEETIEPAIYALSANGMTDIPGGFEVASSLLESEGRKNARQIIVLFSDSMQTVSGNPVQAGIAAKTNVDGIERDIYTIGMAGTLSENEKQEMRNALDQPYATRYIEIDGESDIEGVLYLLGLVNTGAPDKESYLIHIKGPAEVELATILKAFDTVSQALPYPPHG